MSARAQLYIHDWQTKERMMKSLETRKAELTARRKFLMKRLNLSMDRGAIRASLVHYNTLAEVRRFGQTLREVVAGMA